MNVCVCVCVCVGNVAEKLEISRPRVTNSYCPPPPSLVSLSASQSLQLEQRWVPPSASGSPAPWRAFRRR